MHARIAACEHAQAGSYIYAEKPNVCASLELMKSGVHVPNINYWLSRMQSDMLACAHTSFPSFFASPQTGLHVTPALGDVYPAEQVHVKLPTVSEHVASAAQLCGLAVDVHSLMLAHVQAVPVSGSRTYPFLQTH
jgi:hypothetical protein